MSEYDFSTMGGRQRQDNSGGEKFEARIESVEQEFMRKFEAACRRDNTWQQYEEAFAEGMISSQEDKLVAIQRIIMGKDPSIDNFAEFMIDFNKKNNDQGEYGVSEAEAARNSALADEILSGTENVTPIKDGLPAQKEDDTMSRAA